MLYKIPAIQRDKYIEEIGIVKTLAMIKLPSNKIIASISALKLIFYLKELVLFFVWVSFVKCYIRNLIDYIIN